MAADSHGMRPFKDGMKIGKEILDLSHGISVRGGHDES